MEMPTITTSAYTHNTAGADPAEWNWAIAPDFMGQLRGMVNPPATAHHRPHHQRQQYLEQQNQTTDMPTNQKRVVKVFVADPDAKVPADKSLLYTGTEHVTELTDQELFFEVDIKPLLEKHNAERVKLVDKEQSAKFGKEVHLEPIKIRDLRMTVVVVAAF